MATPTSSPSSPSSAPRDQVVRAAIVRGLLVGAEIVLGFSALGGGLGLISGTLGMSDAWLAGTPFSSWVVPGVALLVVVAAPMLTAAFLEARSAPSAPTVSVLAGVAQVGWIAVQLLVFQRYHPLQPTVLVIAAVILVLAGLRSRWDVA